MAVAVRPTLHLVLGDLGQRIMNSGGHGEKGVLGGHGESLTGEQSEKMHKGGNGEWGMIGGHDTNGVLYVTEGEEISVTCVAKSVHPRPSYNWLQSGHILPIKNETWITMSPSSYLVTSYHTVRLNITSTKMNMSTITCRTTQYDNAGNLLYSTNFSGTILVSPFMTNLPDTYKASSATSQILLLLLAVLGILTGGQ